MAPLPCEVTCGTRIYVNRFAHLPLIRATWIVAGPEKTVKSASGWAILWALPAMSRRHFGALRAIAVAVTLAPLSAFSPSVSWAQAAAPAAPAGAAAGWYLTPSVSLTEQWDDNIFRTSSQREADFLTRVTPGFSAGYQSQPLTLLGSFAFDSEIFAEHPNLDGAANGKRAGLQATYLPTRNLTLGLKSAYTETQTPSVLNTITNVEQGRAKATQTNASPTASYQLTPRMAADATYSYTRTTVGTASGTSTSGTSSTSATVAGLTTVTHRADLSLTRQLTPGLVATPDESTPTTPTPTVAPRATAADLGAVAYGLIVSEFEGSPSITSHTLTLGWTHYFTALTSVSLRAGPRYTEGAINPEVDAEIVHQDRSVRLSLAYFRSETTLVGQAGTSKTQGARGSLGWTPLRGMTITVTPSWAQTSSEVSQTTQSLTSQDITVYAADVSLSYQLTRWLTAGAAYHYTRQEQRPATIEDNIVLLRLEIAYPMRLH